MTREAMIQAMPKGAVLVGTLTLAVAAMFSSSALAREQAPRPAYAWANEATLVVAGRVEQVGPESGTLRITKTLAGKADGDKLTFAPTSRPECPTGLAGRPSPPDVAVGDEVALFLVKGERAAYEVLDGGYAKVGLGAHGPWTKAPLASVERLVAAMKTADIDARDRAMIAAATSDEAFLRGTAREYVRDDLGVASPLDFMRAKPEELAVAKETHRAAVRRLGAEIAALVRPDNGADVSGAAIDALDDASCTPEGAFEAIVEFARTRAVHDVYQLLPACRVIARYDRWESMEVLVRLADERLEVLTTMGQSVRPEARSTLLAEFNGTDDHRVLAAASGLASFLERRRDEEIECALLDRLRDGVGPTMESVIGWALRTSRPLDAANAIFDKLSSKSLSKEGEQAGAGVLYDYLRANPPIPGVRELVIKRLSVITDRLDAGKTEATRPFYLLQQLGTPEAFAALRRAAESFPDPALRREAQWRSERLGK